MRTIYLGPKIGIPYAAAITFSFIGYTNGNGTVNVIKNRYDGRTGLMSYENARRLVRLLLKKEV